MKLTARKIIGFILLGVLICVIIVFSCAMYISLKAEQGLLAFSDTCDELAFYLENNNGQWPHNADQFVDFVVSEERVLGYQMESQLELLQVPFGEDICSIPDNAHDVVIVIGPSYSTIGRGVTLTDAIAKWKKIKYCSE